MLCFRSTGSYQLNVCLQEALVAFHKGENSVQHEWHVVHALEASDMAH